MPLSKAPQYVKKKEVIRLEKPVKVIYMKVTYPLLR
jgi:hypothetical protein